MARKTKCGRRKHFRCKSGKRNKRTTKGRYSRRIRRTRRHMRMRNYRGGNACETLSGSATGSCFPQIQSYNGPYGGIPVIKSTGIYPKQV